MSELPSVHSPEVAATQLNAMINDEGDIFYADNEADAALFAEHHGARFVNGNPWSVASDVATAS